MNPFPVGAFELEEDVQPMAERLLHVHNEHLMLCREYGVFQTFSLHNVSLKYWPEKEDTDLWDELDLDPFL